MRSRIARFAMRRRATTVGALILVFVMAGTALAVGPGATFKLGVINSISGYLTTLTGSNNGYMLAVKNTNTNSGARGLLINVAAGRAPIVVNGTAGKALGLNADKVDGKNAADFYAYGSKVADSVHADSADNATNAGYASSAGSATTAGSATNATNATNAGNSDKVDGYDANGLIRVARGASSITLNDTTTSGVAASLSITAPAAGFVHVTGTATNYHNGPGCPCGSYIQLRDAVNGATATWFMPSEDDTAGYDTMSQTWVFPVTAGTRTFQVMAYRSYPAGSTVYAYADMTAIYVPFGSTGAGTLGAAGTSGQTQRTPSR
jgi:hypothetical protein